LPRLLLLVLDRSVETDTAGSGVDPLLLRHAEGRVVALEKLLKNVSKG
jgi:hypothetical protein